MGLGTGGLRSRNMPQLLTPSHVSHQTYLSHQMPSIWTCFVCLPQLAHCPGSTVSNTAAVSSHELLGPSHFGKGLQVSLKF